MKTTIDLGSELELQEWSQENFRMTYAQLATLVALFVVYELTGLPMLKHALDLLVWRHEGRGAQHALLVLEKKGYAQRGPKLVHQATWIITPRGAAKILAVLTAELKSGPGIVSVAEVDELARVAC
jgi:hypothetical protein